MGGQTRQGTKVQEVIDELILGDRGRLDLPGDKCYRGVHGA